MPQIKTDRLIMNDFHDQDAEKLARLGNDFAIARMLCSVPHPFTIQDAQLRIRQGNYRAKPGFRLAIRMDDKLIGEVGYGAGTVMYWLGNAYHGQGLAYEAMQAFIRFLRRDLAVEELSADVFLDNPASVRILQKLGFEQVGQAMGNSAARAHAEPVACYRLTFR